MMQGQMELPLGYSLSLEARILELPLSTRRMSLFLLLPDYLNPGIHQLEANFTTHHIKELMATLKVWSCCCCCHCFILSCCSPRL